jgi:ATP-dependent exoDNAse (exonuclease V) beta subunit
VHNFSNRKLSIFAGSKDNLEIVHGNSDFTLEKDAVVEPTTEEAEDRKLDANDKKKKKERRRVEKTKKKWLILIPQLPPNTAERIFSLLMGEIVETLRKADKDDMSDSFSDISLD